MRHSHETAGEQDEEDSAGDGQAVGVVALLLLAVAAAKLATHPAKEENAAKDEEANGNQPTHDHQNDDTRCPLDHLQPGKNNRW